MKLPTHVPKTLQPTLEEELKLESVILLYSVLIPRPSKATLLKVFKGNCTQAVLDHNNGVQIHDQIEDNLRHFYSDTKHLPWLIRQSVRSIMSL